MIGLIYPSSASSEGFPADAWPVRLGPAVRNARGFLRPRMIRVRALAIQYHKMGWPESLLAHDMMKADGQGYASLILSKGMLFRTFQVLVDPKYW